MAKKLHPIPWALQWPILMGLSEFLRIAMSNILVISNSLPQSDRASGDLRFFSILRILTTQVAVTIVLRNLGNWRNSVRDHARYESMLTEAGVSIYEGSIHSALGASVYDIVFFEFYHPAREFMAMARLMQPDARIVVDSVDVHYNRLQTKARLSGEVGDESTASKVRIEELACYSQADLVIAVSEEDRNVINLELPDCPISVVPNVHEIPPYIAIDKRNMGELLFIGNFVHTPNIDAMIYFVGEVMPMIRRHLSGVTLTIIGNKPPDEILNLANDDIKVLGYVPNIAPYLQSAYLSIAPLRYGGGIKGKVGEAMSYGLPVVTTSFGIEGFDLIPGQHAIAAETPEAMTEAISRLMTDPALYESVSRNGYELIKQRFSPQRTAERIDEFMNLVLRIHPKKPHLGKRVLNKLQQHYHRHIGWRLHA